MRMQKPWGRIAGAMFSVLLVACGGGGSDAGFTGGGGDGGGGVDGTVVPRSIQLLADSPQLLSNAEDPESGVVVTAVVLGDGNNVAPNVTVVFSTTDSASIAVANPAVTDENGRVQAVVTTAGNPANRSITLRATAGSLSDEVVIDVVGTTLSIDGPSNTQAGVPTDYTITLGNGDGGIAGQAVTVTTNSGNTLSSASLTTDSSGQAVVTLTPSVASSSLTVSALGLTTTDNIAVSTDRFEFTNPASSGSNAPINSVRTLSVRWLQSGSPVPDGTIVRFAATRGVLSASQAATAGGVASVTITSDRAGLSTVAASSSTLTRPTATTTLSFVASQASLVFMNADPAVLGANSSSTITATVLDAGENRVANKEVEFSLDDSSGGELSTPLATTDRFGQARVTYTAGPQRSGGSGQEGVAVTATSRNGNGSLASDTVNLTVTDGALRISLATGNEIFEPNETTYGIPYSAIVTDSAGNPAPDADFQLAVFPTFYFKGFYGIDEDGAIALLTTATCANEDLDRDGVLDPGEDVNGSGILEPGGVGSVPGSPALDENGTVQFNITYGQDRGNWIQLLLTARAAVGGSEEVERASFIVPILADDADNPPGTQYEEVERNLDANSDGILGGRFVGSPYGISGNCDDRF